MSNYACWFVRFCLVLLFFSSVNLVCCELKVRTFEFPPFAVKDAHGNWSGIDIDYTTLLLDEVNCQYQFVEMPWKRGIEMMKIGKVDMMLNVTATHERGKNMHFVGPQRVETLILITKKDEVPIIDSWDKMAELKVPLMYQRGTLLGARVEQLMRSNESLRKRLVYLTDRSVNFDMIIKGRAVGFFAEKSYAAYEFEKNPNYLMLQAHPLEINKSLVYFAFSKVSVDRQLVGKLRKGYRRLVEQKRIQQVESQYGNY